MNYRNRNISNVAEWVMVAFVVASLAPLLILLWRAALS